MFRTRFLALVVALTVPTVLAAQTDSLRLAGVHWREIGPYRGGRSVAVAGNPSRPNEFWLGTTGGGVFKSVTAGQSWAPVTDKYFGGTIGAVAVAPSVFISHFHFSQQTYRALGGTSVLIVVGVALQTMRQMESQMVMRHYEGFLR